MSALGTIYLKRETLKTILEVLEKKDQKGIEITFSVNNDSDVYGQNVSSWISQSKEERDSGKKRFFTGSGKIIWHDSKIVKGEKPSDNPTPPVSGTDEDDDLPW